MCSCVLMHFWAFDNNTTTQSEKKKLADTHKHASVLCVSIKMGNRSFNQSITSSEWGVSSVWSTTRQHDHCNSSFLDSKKSLVDTCEPRTLKPSSLLLRTNNQPSPCVSWFQHQEQRLLGLMSGKDWWKPSRSSILKKCDGTDPCELFISSSHLSI